MTVNNYRHCRQQLGAAVGLILFAAAIKRVTADAVCNATTPFARVENDLFNPKYGITTIPFPFRVFDDDSMQDQVPHSMSVPEFVRVFELLVPGNNNEEESSLFDLGVSAREVLDANMPPSPAVLFRNLNQRITTASDFKEFWNGVKHSSSPENAWNYLPYNPRSCVWRPTLDGVDKPADAWPDVLLKLHNEQLCNPIPPTRMALYCKQKATSGGESIIGLNAELTKHLPSSVKTWIEAHGGFSYQRNYVNADTSSEEPHFCDTWQWRAGATTEEEAKRFYTERGWKEEDVTFNENGDISVQYDHPGFVYFNETEVWFNQLQNRVEPMKDGSYMPEQLLDYIELAMWKSVRPLLLQPGDWLVLNNLRVMHGRFPFEDSADNERTLLTVYAENEKHKIQDNVTM